MADSPSASVPRIAVFGATGPTGRKVVEQSLDRDWDVLAIVRNPQKLDDLKDKGLKVAKADIFDSESLESHLKDRDAVISCLGNSDSWGIKKHTFYSGSMTSISTAMNKEGVNRLVVMTSWCTVSKPGNPRFIEWFLKPLLLGRHLSDMATMEDIITKATDFNYTIVRPPGLNNKLKTDRRITEAVDEQFTPNTEAMMSRADVAGFMLNCVTDSKYDKTEVAIGYSKQ